MHKVRGHTRNRSEAPLLEGDFTDEEEEEEKMENTDVRIYSCFSWLQGSNFWSVSVLYTFCNLLVRSDFKWGRKGTQMTR